LLSVGYCNSVRISGCSSSICIAYVPLHGRYVACRTVANTTSSYYPVHFVSDSDMVNRGEPKSPPNFLARVRKVFYTIPTRWGPEGGRSPLPRPVPPERLLSGCPSPAGCSAGQHGPSDPCSLSTASPLGCSSLGLALRLSSQRRTSAPI